MLKYVILLTIGISFSAMSTTPAETPIDQPQQLSLPANIVPIITLVTEQERIERISHGGKIFWFTGLSGSGKSTLSLALERELFNRGFHTKVIDGDNLRSDLCSDLQFSPTSRTENIRRAGAVCELFRQSGHIVLASFISPIQVDRDRLKARFGQNFHEIYVKSSVEECVRRDPKGFYKKAMKGEIPDYTGIKQSYEEPTNPNFIIDTQLHSMEESIEILTRYCLEVM